MMEPGPDAEEPAEPQDSADPVVAQEPGGRPPWIRGVEEKADRHGDTEKRVDVDPGGATGDGDQ